VAVGERDGWPYLVMTRVHGESLVDVWPRATEEERVDVLGQIGALIADVQHVPAGGVAGLGVPWADFIARQIEDCEARHRRLGLPDVLLRDMRPYVDRAVARGALPADDGVLLTGEYTPENLLVEKRDGRWRIAGLIDFGDAMCGPGIYDLLGPSCFLGGGQDERVRALFRGAGVPDTDLGPALAERLMLLLILHRHSDLDVQVAVDGWRERARSFDELAALIWPFSA